MSVSFGKPQTAWLSMYGSKTALTKQIRDKGFRLRTSLGVNDIYAIMAVTCRDYPIKKRPLGQKAGAMFYSNRKYSNVIGFGLLSKDGKSIIGPDWILGLTAGEGQDKALKLLYAKLLSGKIHDEDEMETCLNELERNLRDRDPHAEITLVA